MDSFMKGIKNVAATAGGGDKKETNPDQPSNSELLSSAKQVAEAAKLATSNQSDKIDKPKVAGAAADILDAAKEYGKFDETQGVGQYLKQADDYLHQYEKGSGGTAAAPPPVKEGEGAPPAPVEEKKPEKEESGSGFGAQDALKAAGSFFK
uniref:nodulin-related protein 1-like n=1 Tax=Erigeron canadensis TaxID=72917 RepID=UPI001CB8DDE7|nr:nodulin-related protein 1-like [Erigeron canadensis]